MSGSEGKQLYRSRDALLGGVCAGIADYFATDSLTVRVLAVLLVFVTAGIIVIPYLILWAMTPVEPEGGAPVDVQPEEVHSAVFGRTSGASGTFGASAGRAVKCRASREEKGGQEGASDDSSSGKWHAPRSEEDERRMTIYVMLGIGALLLTLAIMKLASIFVRGMAWWQFWPLLLVIFGIMRMVLPAKPGNGRAAFLLGLVLFVAGVVLLLAFMAPSREVVVTMPYGREYMFQFQPWLQ